MASLIERRVCDLNETFDLSLSSALEIIVAFWTCAHFLNLFTFSAFVLVRVVKEHFIGFLAYSERFICTFVIALSRGIGCKTCEFSLLALIVELSLVN